MALLNGMLDGSAICLVFALTLLVIRPVFASGGAFQPTGAEREARVRLYNDLMSSPILQNQLVPLSQESPVEVRVMLNVYKVGSFKIFLLYLQLESHSCPFTTGICQLTGRHIIFFSFQLLLIRRKVRTNLKTITFSQMSNINNYHAVPFSVTHQ